MNITLDRSFYIPAGALKVCDKLSDAVAYLYVSGGHPAAVVFHGRASKPDWPQRFSTEAVREKWVRGFFESRRARAAAKAADKAKPHGLQVGHVLVSSWGYEQTNVNFYQVTRVTGSRMVEVRAIRSVDAGATGSMSGYVVPAIDDFTGEPMRKNADKWGGVKISDCQRGSLWNGRPVMWTGYH